MKCGRLWEARRAVTKTVCWWPLQSGGCVNLLCNISNVYNIYYSSRNKEKYGSVSSSSPQARSPGRGRNFSFISKYLYNDNSIITSFGIK